jgi:hypothetical protein
MEVLTTFECFSCILECAFDEGTQVMAFLADTRGKHLQRKQLPAWLPPATHAKIVL